MSKIMTPAIERQMKINRKRPVGYIASPFKEAWRRLARNKTAVAGLIVIAIFIIVAIIAPWITKYNPTAQDYSCTLQPPSAEHIFGTDNYGRDIFSRIVYGARVSLPIGLLCAICSLVTGGVIGIVAAYFGGLFEDIIMRLCDIIQAIPPMLLAIAILAALGNGIDKMIIANTIALIPLYARISRAAIYTVKENDYIEAGRAIGAGNLRLMFKHMLPNALGPIIVTTTFGVAGCILVVSSLSYLGLGITAPTPEWGSMLSNAREFLTSAPYYIIIPGIMIMITVFAINLFGDGLRDALDPRLK